MDGQRGKMESQMGQRGGQRDKMDGQRGELDSPVGKSGGQMDKMDGQRGEIQSQMGQSGDQTGKMDGQRGKWRVRWGKVGVRGTKWMVRGGSWIVQWGKVGVRGTKWMVRGENGKSDGAKWRHMGKMHGQRGEMESQIRQSGNQMGKQHGIKSSSFVLVHLLLIIYFLNELPDSHARSPRINLRKGQVGGAPPGNAASSKGTIQRPPADATVTNGAANALSPAPCVSDAVQDLTASPTANSQASSPQNVFSYHSLGPPCQQQERRTTQVPACVT